MAGDGRMAGIESLTVVKPGDTLIVGMNRMITDDEYTVLKERYQALVDAGVHVFLIEGATTLAVFRPDGGDRDG